MTTPKDIAGMIEAAGGTVTSATIFPDGHGNMTASLPLPDDHWLTKEGYDKPPMPFRLGKDDPRHAEFVAAIWAAAKYAIRGATMNGKDDDFDPDALCQNMVVGLIGYHTGDGLSHDNGCDPEPVPPLFPQFAPN